jgi:H+/gluconate symporter-like permease
VAFDVFPPSAQAAAAGKTPDTAVGAVRDILIIVLIIGAAGALAGGLLRSGGVLALLRRFRGAG